MEIENQAKSPQTLETKETPASILKSLVDKIIEKLKTAIEQKKHTDFYQISILAKQLYSKVDLEKAKELYSESQNFFAGFLIDAIKKRDQVFPEPKNEEEVVQILILGFSYYKQGMFANARTIFETLLFQAPHDISSRVYLIPLSAYILYKYLNAIEKDNQFINFKSKIYNWLTLFQSNTYEILFSTVYVFLLRNLLKTGHLRESAQLIKNCRFPEHLGHSLLAKFLFYKAVFLSNIGQINQALNFITESLRKAPDGKNKLGLDNFKLRARKLKIILQLILNEPPSQTWLNESKIPSYYLSLVHTVNRGDYTEFANLTSIHKANFSKDGVLHLLDKMRSVVMKNALKKLSVAYSKISISDVLQKIGADRDSQFELTAFLTKSRADLPEFTVDHKNNYIEFTQQFDDYYNASTRESLIKRIKHLQGLEEQVIKSLKFKIATKEETQENENEKSNDDENNFSDYSINDMDM